MKRSLWCLPALVAGLLGGCAAGNNVDEQSETRWQIAGDGVEWRHPEPHSDHFAMSGRAMDVIVEWRIGEDGGFAARRVARFPMLRTVPDNTHAALTAAFDDADLPPVLCGGTALTSGVAELIRLRGKLEVISRHGDSIVSRRTILPSFASPALLDVVELENVGSREVEVAIPAFRKIENTVPGVFGVYTLETRILGEGEYRLAPGESVSYSVIRSARLADEPPYLAESYPETAARDALVDGAFSECRLETPEPVLNLLFDFSKFHTLESIFSTRGGLMHAPGGYGNYLAGIWANDQAEYANPLFPFLGNPVGNESALNSFRLFAGYMNDDYRPIPSSIVSEGRNFWNGAGDRGDMAMIAHGAARFALASGNPEWGRELLPLIEWSLEFCRRKVTPEGVVASDSDELERRFPAGPANLCTSMLYFDGLERAADLLDALNEAPERAADYRRRAVELKKSVEKYFAAEVQGFATYRYYDGNEVLRSWICMPLVFGFTGRAAGTVDALFSDRLWIGDGLLTAAGADSCWDRSTLYAFRGIFFCGFADRALPYLVSYSRSRLLGDHVPYPVEAYSEGSRSQLAAEGALYCRIFTEGLFGVVPTGFRSFSVRPQLPSGWDKAALRRVHAFGTVFDLTAARTAGGEIEVAVFDVSGGELFRGVAPEGTALDVAW